MDTSATAPHAQPTVFSPAQLYLLDVFAGIKTDAELDEIRQLITDYYAKKLDEHLNHLWDKGVLNQVRLDEINKMDLHAWLKDEKRKDYIGSRVSGKRLKLICKKA